jgi:hypothetical protein
LVLVIAGIPFSSLEIEFGSEDLVNQAIVTGPNGTAISEDLTSQVTYGITALEIDTQLATLAGQEGLADFMIQRFSEPEYRFRSLTCNLRALSPAQVDAVLSIDMGDQVDVCLRLTGFLRRCRFVTALLVCRMTLGLTRIL